nr:hypothetical protein [Abalone asfa-like virus]
MIEYCRFEGDQVIKLTSEDDHVPQGTHFIAVHHLLNSKTFNLTIPSSFKADMWIEQDCKKCFGENCVLKYHENRWDHSAYYKDGSYISEIPSCDDGSKTFVGIGGVDWECVYYYFVFEKDIKKYDIEIDEDFIPPSLFYEIDPACTAIVT